MHKLIEYYGQEIMQAMQETPEAEKICQMWENGYLTYSEAIEELLQATERNKYNYFIQYKTNTYKHYRDFLTTIKYSYQEATEELERLRAIAPAFTWRLRKERKATA